MFQRLTIGAIVLLCLTVPLVVSSLILFLYFRHNIHVSSRSPGLVLVSLVAGFLTILIVISASIASEFTQVSCHTIVWPMLFFIPGFGLPYFFRAYNLYANHKWRAAIASQTFDRHSQWLQNYRRYGTRIQIGIYVGVTLLVLFLTGIGIKTGEVDQATFHLPSQNCSIRFHGILLVIEVLILLLLLLISGFFLRNVRDGFAFKWELVTVLVVGLPVLIIWALNRVVPAMAAFNPQIWPLIVYFMCFGMSVLVPLLQIFRTRKYLLARGDSRSFVMEGLPNVTSNSDFLLLVMDSPPLWDSLQRFMVVNWSIENLHFLAEERRFQTFKGTAEEVDAEARRMYDIFIAPMAVFELNLDSVDREAVMENIMNHVDQATLFEVARLKIFGIVKHDSLPRWRSSPEFEAAWASHTSSKPTQPNVIEAPQ